MKTFRHRWREEWGGDEEGDEEGGGVCEFGGRHFWEEGVWREERG